MHNPCDPHLLMFDTIHNPDIISIENALTQLKYSKFNCVKK